MSKMMMLMPGNFKMTHLMEHFEVWAEALLAVVQGGNPTVQRDEGEARMVQPCLVSGPSSNERSSASSIWSWNNQVQNGIEDFTKFYIISSSV